MSFNEELLDEAVSHALYLERYKPTVVAEIDKILRSTEGDILRRIRELPDGASRTRLERQLRSVRGILDETHERMSGQLDNELRSFTAYELNHELRTLDRIPLSVDFTAPAPNQVYAAAMSRPLDGKALEAVIADFGPARRSAIERAIRQGFVEGESVSALSRRLRGTRRLNYADGIFHKTRRQADALVRTAIQNVATVAREEVYKENASLIKGIRWVSTLDDRTSLICASRDGEVYPVETGPRPPAHYRCRSTTVPVTKSWRELGFDRDEIEEGTRASLKGNVPQRRTYNEWLKSRPEDVQIKVLGETRWELWRRGTPLSQFINANGDLLTLEALGVAEEVTVERVRSKLAERVRDAAEGVDDPIERYTKPGRVVKDEIETRFKAASSQAMADIKRLTSEISPLVDEGAELRRRREQRIWQIVKEDPDADIAKLTSRGPDVPDEIRELDTRIAELDARRRSLQAERSIAYKTYDDSWGNAIRSTLAEVRDIGPTDRGTLPFSVRSGTTPNKKTLDVLTSASEYFPRDWVERSRAGESVRMLLGRSRSRGYYNDTTREIKVRPGDVPLGVHEIGHRMEYHVPGLVDAEAAIYAKRTAGEAPRRLRDIYPGHGYKSSELAREDKFFHAYQGKDYGGRAWEIFTMHYEDVLREGLRDGKTAWNDTELTEWLFGVLATL